MWNYLSLEEAALLGIKSSVKVNPVTNEERARITAAGIDTTITRVPSDGTGGWQQSHRHKRVIEDTLVVTGRVIQVEQTAAGALFFHAYGEGEHFRTHPGLSHNLYVPAGALMVTTKINDDPDSRDWIEDPELDERVCHLSEAEALARVL